MKKLLVLPIILFVCASVSFSQGADSVSSESDISTTIIDMEKKISDALKNSDLETFGSYLGDDFMSVYNFGIFSKSEELKNLQDVELRSYEMSDVKVTQPAPGVAVVTYKVWMEGSHMGEDFSGNYYATSTWVNQDGTWKAAVHAEAETKEMDHDYDSHMDSDTTHMDMEMDSDTLNKSN